MKRYVFIIFVFYSINLFAQFGREHPIAPTFFRTHDGKFIDMDLDGDLDVLSVGYGDWLGIAWSENIDGEGNYSFPEVIFEHPDFRFNKAYPADFDLDGDLDLLVIGNRTNESFYSDRTVYLLENDANNYLYPQEIALLSLGTYQIKDLNNDGFLDIIHLSGENLTWWFYESNLQFGEAHSFEIGNLGAFNFDATDLNDDGAFDIVFATNSPSNIFRYYGIVGTDDFEISNAFSATGSFDDLQFADIDNDEDLDVLVYGYNGAGFEWYENEDALGTFSSEGHLITEIAGNPSLVQTGDFDNDGNTDLIYAFENIDIEVTELFLNLNIDGIGSFDNPQSIFSNIKNPEYSDIGDIDGDGDLDLLTVSTQDYALRIFKNDNNNGFLDPSYLGIPRRESSSAVVIEDFNGDGIEDMIGIYGTELILYYRTELGEDFSHYRILASDLETGSAVAAGDWDLDGDTDLIYSDQGQSSVYTIINVDGEGNFGTPNFESNTDVNSFAVGDLDGDGDLDAFTTNNSINIGWLENDNGTFSTLHTIGESVFLAGPRTITDLDGDGDSDILIIAGFNSPFPPRLGWYEQTSAGDFANVSLLSEDLDLQSVVQYVDFDHDGDVDLLEMTNVDVLLNEGALIELHENTGITNSLWEKDTLLIHLSDEDYADSFCAADFDNDGLTDIIISERELLWYKNVGGTLLKVDTLLTGYSRSVTAHDLNNDGNLDIVLRRQLSRRISWIDNQINHAFLNGHVFLDINENGVQDPDEIGLNNQIVKIDPQGAFSWSGENGIYGYGLSLGDYELSVLPSTQWLITSDNPVDVQILSTDDSQMIDFGLIPNGQIFEANADVTHGIFRCNSEAPVWISYENRGNQYTNGTISLNYSPLLNLANANPPPSSVDGTALQWDITNLPPTYQEQIYLEFETPGVDEIGEFIENIAEINLIDNDGNSIFNQTYHYGDTLICAYDPNDKLVNTTSIDFEDYLLFGDTLEYTIRFQNTGNDTAFNVKITDYLDENLNKNTFRMIAASHDYQVSLNEFGMVEFQFDDILLPDSTTNFNGSQGFVKYAIQLKEGLSLGTIIQNEARIFFDQNPPIITNKTESVLSEMPTSTKDKPVVIQQPCDVSWSPNPFLEQTKITIPDEFLQGTFTLYDLFGKQVAQKSIQQMNFILKRENLATGIYIYEMKNEGRQCGGKIVIQ